MTYNPEAGPLLKLLGQLNRETDFIVIDNGSEKVDQYVESIGVYSRNRHFKRLPENIGLAAALNIGINLARELDYNFVFLFDQDSSLCDLYVKRMLSAYHQINGESERRIAALGPRIINPQTMQQTKFKVFDRMIFRSDRVYGGNSQFFQAGFLITSGTLIPLKFLVDIGSMKASYFIDNVDLEWCFRAKSKGYDLVGTDQAVLYHAIGERSEDPLVKRGIMAQHNPARTYYSSRNRVHLYRLSYSPWGWKSRDFIRFVCKSTWLLMSSRERKQYWKHISAGIRDARGLT